MEEWSHFEILIIVECAMTVLVGLYWKITIPEWNK